MNSTSFSPKDVISDGDYFIIIRVYAVTALFICAQGLITNAINIRTFISMGLKDGVTVTLTGLAISDFSFAFCGFIEYQATILRFLEDLLNLRSFFIHPRVVVVWASNLGMIPYQITCMITMYISIARCMCVSMPFKFKDVFTRTRSLIALLLFFLFAPIYNVASLSQMGVQHKFDPVWNRTRIFLWFSRKRSDFQDVARFVQLIIFNITSCIIVAVCLIVMAKHLKQSVQFRNTMSTTRSAGNDVTEKTNNKLSGKELQVLKQIFIICLIYFISNIPFTVWAIYRLVEDEFDYGKRLVNSYITAGITGAIVTQISSATTFPIYYVYNSKFRSHLNSRWSSPKDRGTQNKE